jgi:hypothetical protein
MPATISFGTNVFPPAVVASSKPVMSVFPDAGGVDGGHHVLQRLRGRLDARPHRLLRRLLLPEDAKIAEHQVGKVVAKVRHHLRHGQDGRPHVDRGIGHGASSTGAPAESTRARAAHHPRIRQDALRR